MNLHTPWLERLARLCARISALAAVVLLGLLLQIPHPCRAQTPAALKTLTLSLAACSPGSTCERSQGGGRLPASRASATLGPLETEAPTPRALASPPAAGNGGADCQTTQDTR